MGQATDSAWSHHTPSVWLVSVSRKKRAPAAASAARCPRAPRRLTGVSTDDRPAAVHKTLCAAWRARLPRAALKTTERPTAPPSSCSRCLLPRPRCRVVGDRPAMTMKVFLGLPACAALPHWSKHSRPPRCSAAARLGFRGVPPRARRDQHAADSPDPRNHLSSELSVGISCCSCRPLSHQRQHLCLRRRLGALSPLLVCASISASLPATGR